MMATRIFCDLCNKLIPSTPPREMAVVAIIPPTDPFSTEKTRTVGIKMFVPGDFCDECKSLMITKLMTDKAFQETQIHRFGEKK